MHKPPLAEQQEQFMNLLKPIQRSLEKFALGLTKDRDDARDLVQDAISATWQRFSEIHDHGAFKSYIFTTAINVFRNKHRRAKWHSAFTDDMTEMLRSADPLPDRYTEGTLLHEALQHLTPTSREAIVLYEMVDLSITDVAKIQNSTEAAVKVRLMRARKQLQNLLGISPSVQQLPVGVL